MKTAKLYPMDAAALKYLRGDAFSNGLEFLLPGTDPEGFAVDRLQYLEAACRGKRVLHLGCCDHPPLIRQRIAENRWLHGRLTAVAGRCLGVDIDAEAVAIVRDQLGRADVLCADLSESVPPEVQAGKPWDLLVAGEIVEHLDNPVLFLAGLRQNLKGLCPEIMVTAPNAFRQANFRHVLSDLEHVNTDHRYWFTAFTLAKVLTRAGFTPVGFDYVDGSLARRPRSLKSAFQQWRRKRHPALRETLIMAARFV